MIYKSKIRKLGPSFQRKRLLGHYPPKPLPTIIKKFTISFFDCVSPQDAGRASIAKAREYLKSLPPGYKYQKVKAYYSDDDEEWIYVVKYYEGRV